MSQTLRPGVTSSVPVLCARDGRTREVIDDVATEEPLQIRLVLQGGPQNVAVTMRTPGNDFELAAGFLFSEGIIDSREAIQTISYCVDPQIDAAQQYNIVNVAVTFGAAADPDRLERHFTVNSSCGVCGKATIDALGTRAERLNDGVRVTAQTLDELPAAMRAAQRVFASTGGLHACALFDAAGTLLALREDVGRHNAFDKIVGWALLEDRMPLQGCIALVSGRASFELVQKAILARIPVLCAVSAPSSLAVELAGEFGVTLVGFVREGRANIYTGRERLALP
ncbi:MAG TPA: formate dehydrogenase accessory sulfurtransferase FdhD [Candidatus Baltobacteraceae bacterium]|jgi:FdhD protein|nr:formate dehydrogenase accessory sulfurtransferase FdhD [Candidatus Baltobacteraceae bacterium]